VQAWQSVWLEARAELGEGDRLEVGPALVETGEELTQEGAATIRVVEPGVLSVESDDDAGLRRELARQGNEMGDHVAGCASLVLPMAVDETDPVRQPAVAEEQGRAR